MKRGKCEQISSLKHCKIQGKNILQIIQIQIQYKEDSSGPFRDHSCSPSLEYYLLAETRFILRMQTQCQSLQSVIKMPGTMAEFKSVFLCHMLEWARWQRLM